MKIQLDEQDIIKAIHEYVRKNHKFNVLGLKMNYDMKETLFKYHIKLTSIDVNVEFLKNEEENNNE
ncbi:hypothetical protein D3C71_1247350 [compost metagenome]